MTSGESFSSSPPTSRPQSQGPDDETWNEDINFNWEIQFSDLVLLEQIGAGASAEVWKALCRGTLVAVKIFRNQSVTDDNLDDLRREISALRALHHPNIVQFVAACLQPPSFCLCVEFLGGGSLHEVLHGPNHRKLDLLSIIALALGIAFGLRYLHRCQCIHRDLKPANIVMDDRGHPKLVDFGQSRFWSEEKRSQMSSEVGSYRYAAPEVLRSGAYTPKSDVYSFGIVLAEMVTGELPFKALSPIQAALGVAQKKLRPPLPEDQPNCPLHLANLIRLCWDDDPEVRPTFETVAEMLRSFWKDAKGSHTAHRLKHPSIDVKTGFKQT